MALYIFYLANIYVQCTNITSYGTEAQKDLTTFLRDEILVSWDKTLVSRIARRTLSRANVPCIEVILRDLPGPSTFPGWPTTGPSGFWSPEWVSGKGQQWIGDLRYRHVWPSNNPDRSNLAMPYGSHGLSRLVNGLWVVRRPAIKQFSFISIHLVIL